MTHSVILVRHGEHVDAEHGVLEGPLSPRGNQQADLLAARLSGLTIDSLWHSPLKQTWDTAATLSRALMSNLTPPPCSCRAFPRALCPTCPRCTNPSLVR